ncbi:MAG: RsmE family RNA methyltransferase [Acidimicrobiales bacterium]
MAAHPADHPGPLAFVDDLDDPTLRPDDRHHLERAVRLRAGDALVVGDGAGRWRPAAFGPTIQPVGPIEEAAVPSPAIGVGFALVKGDKPELVVQKLTELGVDLIVPFRADRSIVRWDSAKAAKAGERLRAVARSAAEQCRRPWLPEVGDITDLDALLGAVGPVGPIALADRTGGPPSLDHPFVLIGPEGGWTDEERVAAGRRGAPRVVVGAHVLRAETAAVTVGALLTALRAGFTGPMASS